MSVVQEIHLRSLEEEDLIHRSTKKIKDGASEIMDVEIAANVGEIVRSAYEIPKPSYKDKVMEIDP
ncbi:hypothetical protein SESBI_42790 [Sesbania bispinosa]|nr:hypothetical protein SESBI_42790 [Sesbania bispinosa]